VKNQQSKEAVDRAVTHGGYHESDTLSEKRQLEIRTLVGVVQVIRLQGQRFAWIGHVRYVSHGDPEAWQNKKQDKRREHYNESADYDHTRDLCASYHNLTLLVGLEPQPIFGDHVQDRRESFKGRL